MRQSDFYVAAVDACYITQDHWVKQTGHKQEKGRQLINELKKFTPLASGTNKKRRKYVINSEFFKHILTGCVQYSRMFIYVKAQFKEMLINR